MTKERVKILYIVSTLRQSGPTNQLLGIVKNLDNNIFSPTILTLSPEPENSKIHEFVGAGIPVKSLNLNRIQFSLYGKKLLKKFIKGYEPEIIHTSGVRADTVVSRMKISAKHCMTVRNFVYEDYISKFGRFIGNIAAISNIKAMKRCEYVICCSETLKKQYTKILPNKLYSIQNGVDVNQYKSPKDKNEKNRIRSNLDLPLDRKIFLVVGSLIDRKDPLFILKAFQKAQVGKKALLIFLGDGKLMNLCQEVASDNVKFKGNVTNVRDYLKASDYFISASKSEGLPNSVLEAGISGLNMILSDIPQHREIFNTRNNLVDFFPLGNEDMLIELINNAVKRKKPYINNNIVEHIDKNFSTKVMSEKYEKLYLKMCNSTER